MPTGRGQIRQARNKSAEAEADFDKVITLDPSNAGAHIMRGLILAERNQGAEAEADFRKVVSQAREFADAQGSLAWLLITQGRFAEALSNARKAHELDPESYATAVNLGHVYLLTGDRQTADEYYEKTVALLPDEAALTSGPLADFKLFIKKGWQPKACKEEAAWFRKRFAQKQAKPRE